MEYAGQQRPQGRTGPPPRPPPPGAVAAANDSATQQASAGFKTFQTLHDKAFAAVQKGLNADENGDTAEAERCYAACLPLLDQVLVMDCENLPGASSQEKDSAKQMQQKMNKTRLQISYRLESLRGDVPQLAHPEADFSSEHRGVRLPSYDEAVSSSSHSSLISDAVLGDSIMSAEYSSQAAGQRFLTEGTEVFSVPDGVQIFHITKEGYVSAPSYPTSMHIVKLQEAAEGDEESRVASNAPPAFIQVGDWIYPLVPGTSPVLHTTYHAYLFPDLSSEAAGSSVGLLLPDTVSEDERHMLGDVLRNLSAVQEQQTAIQPEDLALPSPPTESPEASATAEETRPEVRTEEPQPASDQTTARKISQGILVASKWISWGVGKGAEKAGELITQGSQKLRQRLQPSPEAKPVDPRVQKGMVYARKATNVAVSVSGYVVTKLGEATMALGREVGPRIMKQGEKYMPKSMKSEKGKAKMDGVIEVAASGLHGFGTIYMSLEGAAKALARSLANETVATVHHKYGEYAGKLTENIVYSTGNIGMTAYNANNLGVKAIAKRAAKDTGKAVIEDLSERSKGGAKQSNGQVNGASADGSRKSSFSDEKKDAHPAV